ncbi:MAG: diaminopimelate decarboxylase [Candidatus Wallbacteria bacterium]|nr:diaminopimelate decarboxylase [Candidatus Wallbacteria bacterium]
MKKKYEKPVIQKLQTGMTNKFGTPSTACLKKIRSRIEGVEIEELVQKFGSPLFVFSENTIRNRYRTFANAFTTRYPDVEFSWSYKTNYLDAICCILHQEGESAEVVSEFEYDKALRIGVPSNRIIFNGPYKPVDTLKKVVLGGGRINLDHYEEIQDLEKTAADLGKTVQAGLRINLDAGISPQWTRFGFNLENGQAQQAMKRIRSGRKIQINGLHCHLGTFILEQKAYGIAARKLCDFLHHCEKEFGVSIEYIDMGGGFPSCSRLKGIYLPPELAVPSIETYAEEITGEILKKFKRNPPRLILESGRYIIDEAGFLITSVHAAKTLPGGLRAYVLDAGVNILFTSNWYKFNIELTSEVPGPNVPSVLYGPLCMNIDLVDEHTYLPSLPRGTKLVLSPVGAYNQTQSMQFIRYRPASLLIGRNGEIDLIREAETLQDIVRLERIPDRLRLTDESK